MGRKEGEGGKGGVRGVRGRVRGKKEKGKRELRQLRHVPRIHIFFFFWLGFGVWLGLRLGWWRMGGDLERISE